MYLRSHRIKYICIEEHPFPPALYTYVYFGVSEARVREGEKNIIICRIIHNETKFIPHIEYMNLTESRNISRLFAFLLLVCLFLFQVTTYFYHGFDVDGLVACDEGKKIRLP